MVYLTSSCSKHLTDTEVRMEGALDEEDDMSCDIKGDLMDNSKSLEDARNLMAGIGLSVLRDRDINSFHFWLGRCGFTEDDVPLSDTVSTVIAVASVKTESCQQELNNDVAVVCEPSLESSTFRESVEFGTKRRGRPRANVSSTLSKCSESTLNVVKSFKLSRQQRVKKTGSSLNRKSNIDLGAKRGNIKLGKFNKSRSATLSNIQIKEECEDASSDVHNESKCNEIIGSAEAEYCANIANDAELKNSISDDEIKKVDDTEDGDIGKSVGMMNCDMDSKGLLFLRYQCFICQGSCEEYSTYYALSKHIKKSHVTTDSKDNQILSCPMCESERKVVRGAVRRMILARMLSHMMRKHGCAVPDYIQPFQCEQKGCTYTAIHRNEIKRHMTKHTGVARVPCDRCGRVMSNITALLYHHKYTCHPVGSAPEDIMNVVKSRERFPCSQCDKSLISRQALERHVQKTHEGRRDFLCSHCTSSFGEKRELINHAFRKHRLNLTNKPIVRCTECSYETVMASVLRTHFILMHTNERKPQCTVCGRVCSTPWTLKRHMTSHGEKNEKCNMCSYVTARRSTLEEHIKAQHIGYQYQCEQCGYTTGYYANLCKHRRLTCNKQCR